MRLAGLRRANWLSVAEAMFGALGGGLKRTHGIPPEQLARALYRGILGREPDLDGLRNNVGMLRSGNVLEEVIRTFIASPEFQSRFLSTQVPQVNLPDLTALMPERYDEQIVTGSPRTVYLARSDADIVTMAALIDRHRFYDQFGVWSPVIDLDKEITAAIVRGLGAESCFELGCFTGPVLSLLADAGVQVLGSEVSHLAFAFAYPNARDAMLYGDLLTLEFDRQFDVVLCMDVLEHIDPLRLDRYIEKCISLLNPDGYLYLNSPMWGEDPVFGVFEEPYLDEWRAVGDAAFWRHWPCDDQGWPVHGHLVWASPAWWTRKFAAHGLVRDHTIERAIQYRLTGFFENAVGRRCLFVLRRPENTRASEAVADGVAAALAACRGIPEPAAE